MPKIHDTRQLYFSSLWPFYIKKQALISEKDTSQHSHELLDGSKQLLIDK